MAEEERPKISELATVPIQPAQWYTLGLQLGLEEDVLSSIEQEQLDRPMKCKRAMFRKWLESTPTASWNDLIKALVRLEKKKLPRKLKKSSPPLNPLGQLIPMKMVTMVMITIATTVKDQQKMKLIMASVTW